jgi:hypothetical protein
LPNVRANPSSRLRGAYPHSLAELGVVQLGILGEAEQRIGAEEGRGQHHREAETAHAAQRERDVQAAAPQALAGDDLVDEIAQAQDGAAGHVVGPSPGRG